MKSMLLLLTSFFLFTFSKTPAMQSTTQDPNQALIDAARSNNETAARTALNNGATVQYNGHQPIYETLYHDNLEIFKLLIPYYESIGSWHYAAEQENATKIASYIKDQKLIRGNSKKA